MPSFKTTVVAAAALFISSASTQLSRYPIDVEGVDIGVRRTWCTNQKATCPLLCLQNGEQTTLTVAANDCDPQTLNFDCVCTNGISPNASEYSQTIPFFICQNFGEACVAGCNGASLCSSKCRSDNPCGAQNPIKVNVTTTSSAAGSEATSNPSGVVYDGFGSATTPTAAAGNSGSGNAAADKSAGMMAVDLGRSYGLAVVFTGIFAGFALVL